MLRHFRFGSYFARRDSVPTITDKQPLSLFDGDIPFTLRDALRLVYGAEADAPIRGQ